MLKELKFNNCKAVKKQFISTKNQQKSLKFGLEYLKKDDLFWDLVTRRIEQIFVIWDNLKVGLVEVLADSASKRLILCVEAKGKNSKYQINFY